LIVSDEAPPALAADAPETNVTAAFAGAAMTAAPTAASARRRAALAAEAIGASRVGRRRQSH
jgi:hypothetical protein